MILPIVVSGGLVGWVLSGLDGPALWEAMSRLPWQRLVPLTLGMVAVLYLWDTICMRLVFVVGGRMLPFRTALYVQGIASLFAAVNYQLGQGFVAWMIAVRQRMSFLSALSRSVLLAIHDLTVLFSLGLIGSLVSGGDGPQVKGIRLLCGLGLAAIVALVVAYQFLPDARKRNLRELKFGAWIESWSWRRTGWLLVLRAMYFSVSIVYAAMAFHVAGVGLRTADVLGAIPLVLVAGSLPSVSDLGTREATLVLLLAPAPTERIVAVSLIWTSGMIAGRVVIGLLAVISSLLAERRTEECRPPSLERHYMNGPEQG
jgi:hypothetical protein